MIEHAHSDFFRSYVRWLWRMRLLLVASILPLIIYSLLSLESLEWDTSPRSWLIDTDEISRNFDAYSESFGVGEFVVVGISADTLLANKSHVSFINSLESWLRERPEISRTQSVLSSASAHITSSDEISIKLPERSLDDLAILKNESQPGGWFSADKKSTVIYAWLRDTRLTDGKSSLIKQLRDFVRDTCPQGVIASISGVPVLSHDFYDISSRESLRNISWLYGVLFFASTLLFRNCRIMLSLVLVVFFSNAVMLVLGNLLEYKINNITVLLPVLILGISVGTAFHIISKISTEVVAGNLELALASALKKILRPSLLTTLTTLAGFAGLMNSSLAPLRQLGILAIAGISAAFLSAFTVIPALWPRSTELNKPKIYRVIPKKYITALFNHQSPGVLVLLTLLATSLSGFLALKLNIGLPFIDYFSPALSVHKDTRYLEEKFGAVVPLEFILTPAQLDSRITPTNLAAVLRIQNSISQKKNIFRTSSIGNVLNQIDHLIAGNSSAPAPAWTHEKISQYLFLADTVGTRESSEKFFDEKTGSFRIHAMASMMTATEFGRMMDFIKKDLAHLAPGFSLHPTGLATLYIAVETYLYDSLLTSFFSALCLIVILMLTVYRSLRLIIIFLVPNIIPIFFVLAACRLMGKPINIGMVMMASITLGIIVDDTIHLLNTFIAARKAGHTPLATIHDMGNTGAAIMAATVVLVASFLVAANSSFVPNQSFGIASSATLLLGMLVELTLIPALIKLFYSDFDLANQHAKNLS